MTTSSLPLEALRKTIEAPKDGFVGIVDDVLSLCRDHSLSLDWRDNRCEVRSAESGEVGVVEMPLRRSGFRTILARIAKLCGDRSPGAHNPYGGQGELLVGPEPAMVFRVEWSNTLAEQFLTLTPVLANEFVNGQDQPNTNLKIHETLSRHYASGHTDTGERHNEHQP